MHQAIEARKSVYGNCSEGLAEALRKITKDKLEAYIKRMNKELSEKGGNEHAVAKEKKAACIRCQTEETINSRRDGKGPGLVRSLS